MGLCWDAVALAQAQAQRRGDAGDTVTRRRLCRARVSAGGDAQVEASSEAVTGLR